jgi:DNA polymerase III epsilon subunit-like protein
MIPKPPNIFGFDVETTGTNVFEFGGLSFRPPQTTHGPTVTSIALSAGKPEQQFIGAVNDTEIFRIKEFLRLGQSGERDIGLKLAKGGNQKLLKFLEQQGYIDLTRDQPHLNITQGQLEYLQRSVQDKAFYGKYVAPGLREARESGGKIFKNEGELVEGFIKHLESIGTTPNEGTIVGHNIGRFDIPHIQRAAKRSGKSERLKEALRRFTRIDTYSQSMEQIQRMYRLANEVIKSSEIGQAWLTKPDMAPGASLDLMNRMLGITGRASTEMHGPLEDSMLAVELHKKLIQNPHMTATQHLEAMAQEGKHAESAQRVLNSLGRSSEKEAEKEVVKEAGKVAAQEVKKPKPSNLFDGKSLEKFKGLFKKNVAVKIGIAGAAAAGIWAIASRDEDATKIRNTANTLFDTLTSPFAARSEYISSSTLGMTNQWNILGRVYDPELSDQHYQKTNLDVIRGERVVEHGNILHELIQEQLKEKGLARETEKYVEDPTNKVFGYIDVMMRGGTPLEIKSIGESQFNRLSAPKPEHVSQANFYALVTNSNSAMIMYVSRGDSTKKKVFNISADQGMYERDVNRIRDYQEKTKHLGTKNYFLSGFRPINSWFGGGINYNIPSIGRSKMESQRAKLSNLAMAAYMPQSIHAGHPNHSRMGVTG